MLPALNAKIHATITTGSAVAMAKTAEQLKDLPYVGRVLPERIGQDMEKDEQEEMER